MKTIKKQIKTTLLLITLIITATIYGQTENKNTQMFVRIYNMDGKKINKGRVVFVRDSLLGLKRDSKTFEITYKEIGFIKTKHSEGHNVLMGATVGATSLGIIGAVSAEPDAMIFSYSSGEGAAAGIVLGGIAGAAVGGITILFKKTEVFIVQGDLGKFKAFKDWCDKM